MLNYRLRPGVSNRPNHSQVPRRARGAILEPLEVRRLLSVSIAGAGASVVATPPATVVSTGILAVGVTIHAEATDTFSGTVGKLENFVLPPAPAGSASPIAVGLQEIIDWGDGTASSAGSLVAGAIPRTFLVKGSHTYSTPGKYKITTSVVWGPLPGSGITTPSDLLATIHSNAVVSKDNDGGVTLNEVAGKSFKANVGSFDFRSLDLILSATINWGDGKQSAGEIVGNFATGEYHVVGSHTFAKIGQYKVTVKVLTRLAGSPVNSLPTGLAAQWVSTINVLGSA
jgi:hypothetical protein